LAVRFDQEAELLGRLQHPGIAQIHAAGSTNDAGVPWSYFAMEFVDGLPLDQFASVQHLSNVERLLILARICEAMHHAHQKGIIHRDLKPGNILVTPSGQPKILDFGIARVVDSDLQLVSMHTGTGELVGTIPYMSPEQASGDPGAIDIRSDVYALGVVGYQLLTGQFPYDLQKKPIHDAVRIIREADHVPLSRHVKEFRGDLDTIFGKALEKDSARRYQSALALAEDIGRFLDHQPITARPPNLLYQTQKFARRNSLLVGGGLGILALLVIGVVATSVLAIQLKRQRDAAVTLQEQTEITRRQAESARKEAQESMEVQIAISGFLQDVFAAGSPYVAKKDMTITEALDWAAERVDEKLAAKPEAAAAVRMRLADTYFSLGRQTEAIEQMDGALKDSLRATPKNIMDIAMIRASLGQLYLQSARLDLAKEHLESAMELIEAPALRDQPVRSLTMVNYGALLMQEKRYDEALPIFKECLRLREHEFGKLHPYTLTVLNNLAVATREVGDSRMALQLAKENMQSHRTALGNKHPNTITGIYNYADLLRDSGEHAQSRELFEECIALGTAHLPTRHFLMGKYHSGYGELLRVMKRLEESESELKLGLEILEEQLGANHPDTIRARERLSTLRDEGKHSVKGRSE
jgi:tetratricopeptide (TPR) repeat protein